MYYFICSFAYYEFGYLCAADLPPLGLMLGAFNTVEDENE